MILSKINSSGFDIAVQRLVNQSSNRIPLMRKIGGMMHDDVEQNFESEGRPKWVDLSPRTIKARERKKKWPGKILQVSGQLVNSIQIQVDNDSAIVGTNKVYGPAMEYGNPRNNTPARPFLTIQDKTIDEIETEITRYVLRGVV